jgi:hypothetical protein
LEKELFVPLAIALLQSRAKVIPPGYSLGLQQVIPGRVTNTVFGKMAYSLTKITTQTVSRTMI